jgi:hypothetical protein
MRFHRRSVLAGVGGAVAGLAGCSDEPSPEEKRAERALESDRAYATAVRGVSTEKQSGEVVAVGVDYFLKFEASHTPAAAERRANSTALAVAAAFYGSYDLTDLFVRGYIKQDDAERIDEIDDVTQDVVASAVGIQPAVAANNDLAAMDPTSVPEVASPYIFKPKLFE